MGGLAVAAGLAVGAVSLVLGFGGWQMARLWLWLLGSAMLILIGVQLVISWIVMRVLEELSQREVQVGNDLAAECKIAPRAGGALDNGRAEGRGESRHNE